MAVLRSVRYHRNEEVSKLGTGFLILFGHKGDMPEVPITVAWQQKTLNCQTLGHREIANNGSLATSAQSLI
jgi:hypothetical protein